MRRPLVLLALVLVPSALAPIASAAPEPAPVLEREHALARQLVRERASGEQEQRALVRRVRSLRATLGDDLVEPLGRAPRNLWERYPASLPRQARLARQLVRERVQRADVRFWLASSLRANSRLAWHVRHPSPLGNRALASALFGWEYPCAATIIEGETAGTWDERIWNRQGSGAYGLGQARPRSKMLATGADAYSNPLTQLRWLRDYASERYGSLCDAAARWSVGGSW